MLVLGAAVSFVLITSAGAAWAATSPGHSCVTAGSATYRHTFDGPAGTATITAVDPLCGGRSQTFSLVSYTATAGGRFVYDTDRAVVDASHRKVTLRVAVPGCATEVDAVFGTDVRTEIAGGSTAYGTTALGSASGLGHRSSGTQASYHGGRASCAARPSVTFASACDGGFTATLTSGAAAVNAAFVVDGHTYRVAPGARTRVVGEAGGTLTVRDNTFRTRSGTWSKPPVCVQPTPSSTTVPAAPPSTVPTSTAAHPTSTAPSPAAPTTAAPTTAAPSSAAASSSSTAGADYTPTTPGGTLPAAPAVTLPVTGMGAGSVALIAFGLLLIGGGLLLLGRQFSQARHAV
ncbi:hypothetical protein ACWKSP_06445 [Micromonosporaceae bacterium Da 78-11]